METFIGDCEPSEQSINDILVISFGLIGFVMLIMLVIFFWICCNCSGTSTPDNSTSPAPMMTNYDADSDPDFNTYTPFYHTGSHCSCDDNPPDYDDLFQKNLPTDHMDSTSTYNFHETCSLDFDYLRFD